MKLIQRLIRDVVYPAMLLRKGEGAQLRYAHEYERTQHWQPRELRQLQWERLRALLDHAYRQCPFYRERFERSGVVPGDIRSPEDLTALPVLEKWDIQEQRDRMVAKDWPRDDLILHETGGSTGHPLSFYMSRDRKCSRGAATIRHNRWAGWDIGTRVAFIWGAPSDQPDTRPRSRARNALIKRQVFLNAGHLTEAKLAAFHEALLRFRPEVISGYAQATAMFARYLREHGLSPYRPRSVVTSAEMLNPDDRAVIEEVFGCPVFDRYGCREVSVIASECEAHQGLHTMAEGVYLEVVRGDRPAAPGEPAALLVTDLLNLAMPLIRYRVGDVAAWAEGVCPCGRGLPRLEKVAGRVADFLVGSDGRVVAGPFLAHSVVAARPSLGQLQIEQDEAGKVRYRIRKGVNFREPQDLQFLTEVSKKYLGEATAVDWEFVDELAPTPSGKVLFCRSSVTPDFLAPRA